MCRPAFCGMSVIGKHTKENGKIIMYEKKSRSWIKHLDFIIGDILAITIAFLVSYGMRFGVWTILEDGSYRSYYLVLLGLHILASFFFRNYSDIVRRGYGNELIYVLKHNAILGACTMCWLVFTKQSEDYSRLVLGMFLLLDIACMFVIRDIWKHFVRRHMTENDNSRKLLIVTTSSRAETCVKKIHNDTYQGYEVCGIALLDGDISVHTVDGYAVVADEQTLIEYVLRNVVDEVLIETGFPSVNTEEICQQLLNMGIVVHVGVDYFFENMPNMQVGQLGSQIVITSSIQTAGKIELALKRVMDICGALAGLLITGIVCIFVAPAIYIKSPGPIFFSQVRVGKNGRFFKIYKFRSMYMDAEERKKELMEQNKMSGLMFKMDDDPRIIKGIGHFIRNTSIDELPQFWNILKGDMSLVGTRPPTREEYEQYSQHHKIRLSFRPGLTGMWQVSGRSNITDFEEVVRLDEKYIEEWSIWLDVRIIFKTIAVVLMRKGSE